MSLAREHQRDAVFIGRGNDLGVSHAAARLYDGPYPCGCYGVQAVAEGEEGITGRHTTLSTARSTLHSDTGRIQSVLLTGPYAEGLTVLDQHDGV